MWSTEKWKKIYKRDIINIPRAKREERKLKWVPGEFFFEGYEILYFWEAQQWFISRRGKLFRNISWNRVVDSFMQNLTFDMTKLLKSSAVFKILLTFHPLASFSFLSWANALTQYWTNTIQHPAMVGKCLSGLPFTAKLANYFIYTHVRYEFNLDIHE